MPEPSLKPDRPIDTRRSEPWPAASAGRHLIWSRRGTAAFETILDLLIGHDRAWTTHASGIAIVCASHDEASAYGTRSFVQDSAAELGWIAEAIESRLLRWHAYGSAGLDWARAGSVLDIPDGYRIEAAVAIGRVRMTGEASVAPAGSGLLH